MGFVSGFCFCVHFVRGLAMGVSVETHEFVINGVVTNFVAQKLLSPIWGND
jgi:hypothetical protein